MIDMGGLPLSFEQWRDRVKANLDRDLPNVTRVEWLGKAPPMCIVATGPSLKRHLGALKRLRKQGARLMALNRAYSMLVREGLPPDLHVMMHPVGMLDAIEPRDKNTWHLLASQVEPEVFDALKDRRVAMWHAHSPGFEHWGDPRIEAIMVEAATVGVASLHLSRFLGQRDLHLFGFDGSHQGTKRHFRHQAGDEALPGMQIDYGGEKFTLDGHLAVQAEQFSHVAKRQFFNMTFHGRGLLAAIYEKEAA